MSKKRATAPAPAPAAPASLLADLLAAQGFTASPEPEAAATLPQKSDAKGIDLSRTGKIIVRRERKGRKGKTVTIVSGLNLPAPQLDELARMIRKGLGCGSVIEEHTIVAQGDIVDRVQAWLTAHGATRVVTGG